MTRRTRPTSANYRTLAEFRYQLRCFLAFSEDAAARTGLTPRQHQALLAIKGWKTRKGPTIGDLAERLCIRHHSAVELVDRLTEAGLVIRAPDEQDRRRVRLVLSSLAEDRLLALSVAHLEELRRIRPALIASLDELAN